MSDTHDTQTNSNIPDFMREAAEACARLNTPLRIYEKEEQLPRDIREKYIEGIRDGSIRAWYDPVTGDVGAYAPNCTSKADAMVNVWHEVVAHKGLRGLFGKDYDELCLRVCYDMSDKERGKQLMYAYYAKSKDELRDILGHEAPASYANLTPRDRQRFACSREVRMTVGDEYMAKRAERGDFSNATLWQRIKEAVLALFRKAGVTIGVTDTDIRAMLSKSSELLQAANARRDDITATEGRGFYFGSKYDYSHFPLGCVEAGLADKSVNVVAVPRHDFKGTGKEATKAAREWAHEKYDNTVIPSTRTRGKGAFRITPDCVKKMTDPTSTTASDSLGLHLAVLTRIDEVIAESVDVESHPDFEKGKGVGKLRLPENGYDTNAIIHRMYAAIKMENDDNLYRVKITATETQKSLEPSLPHDFAVTKIELLSDSPGDRSSQRTLKRDVPALEPMDLTTLPCAKLLKDVEMSYNKGVKVLEESERMSLADRERHATFIFRIGEKRKAQMRHGLSSKLTDMTSRDIERNIREIERLGEQNDGGRGEGNPKLEKAAYHWLLNGSIRLPEDSYKVLDALSVAEKKGIDPLGYASPLALMDAHIDTQPSLRKTNPDTIRSFRNKRELQGGYTIYDVANSRKAMDCVRQMIDEHWGVDANPWCLAARDGAKSMDSAWYYWRQYKYAPKRIVFKDGKLAFFSASDHGLERYWDRQDKEHYGLPLETTEHSQEWGERKCLSKVFSDDTTEIEKTWQGNTENGTFREWHNNGQLEEECHYKNGLPEGDCREYWENGKMRAETHYKDGRRDGLCRTWHPSGNLRTEERFRVGTFVGTHRKFFDNGQLYEEYHYDDNGRYHGTCRSWSRGGWLEYEANYSHGNIEGLCRRWQAEGILESATNYHNGLREGISTTYHRNGQLKEEIEYHNQSLTGFERRYDINGMLRCEINAGTSNPHGYAREWYKDGSPKSERHYRYGTSIGLQRAWSPAGNITYEEYIPHTRGADGSPGAVLFARAANESGDCHYTVYGDEARLVADMLSKKCGVHSYAPRLQLTHDEFLRCQEPLSRSGYEVVVQDDITSRAATSHSLSTQGETDQEREKEVSEAEEETRSHSFHR